MTRLIAAFAALIFLAVPTYGEVAIQKVTSPGGVNAWLVEEHAIPFTALEIRFRGGTSLDAPGKRGATNLMTGLIEEGAGDLDARSFAAAREALAASYSFGAYDDALTVSAQFLTENRPAAVALLKSALSAPRFDDDAIERVRGQVLSHIRSRATDPNAIAGSTFDGLAFGDHPYGSDSSGTVDTVTALTRQDIVNAYSGAIARDRIYLAAVGDITAQELGALMDRLFSDLPETGAPQSDTVAFGLGGGVTVVPFETPQSVAKFGHAGITRDDPDFFAAYVVNQIMGGGNFNSRLMQEVREKRGLTYGVNTYLVPMDLSEMVIGFVASANERMAQTLDVIRAQWAKLATQGITAKELKDAQTYLTGAYPLRFDGNGPIARIMVGMQMQGLPIDYIATRNDRINAVTLQEANRVAARVYRPDALHFVVVGQPVGVETGK